MQCINTYLLGIVLSVMLGGRLLYASTDISEKVNSFPIGKKIVVKVEVEKAKSYKGWYIAGAILSGVTIVIAAVLGG